jgi:3-methyladenine DNA glycosylase AlkC
LFIELQKYKLSIVEIGSTIIDSTEDYRTIGVGLGILAQYGLEDYQKVLPYFEFVAKAENFEPREYAQGMFRKVVKAHRREIRNTLLEYAQSENPKMRRFVSEMLRPVVENQWINDDIEYSVTILRNMFKESNPYPRKSVGNNLSDIARRNPEIVYQLVEELVSMQDKNAYWIATRACRNLVKQDPIRVMNLLGVDEYKYKKQVYMRNDYLEKND